MTGGDSFSASVKPTLANLASAASSRLTWETVEALMPTARLICSGFHVSPPASIFLAAALASAGVRR